MDFHGHFGNKTNANKNKHLQAEISLFELQDELESSKELATLLSRATVILSLAADGVSPDLDKLFSKIRKVIRKKDATEQLECLLEQVEEKVRQLDQDSNKQKEESSTFLSRLFGGGQEKPQKADTELSLQQQSPVADLTITEDQPTPEAPHIKSETSNAQDDPIKHSANHHTTDQTLDQPRTKTPDQIPDIPTQKQTSQTTTRVEASNAADSYEGEVIRERIVGILLSVLHQQHTPDTLCEDQIGIEQLLTEGFQWPEFPSTLSKALSFLLNVNLHEEKQFEIFLQLLNSRLNEIQQYLSTQKTEQLQNQQAQQDLGNTISDSINSIKDTIINAGSVDALSSIVDSQLNGILHAVETFQAPTADSTTIDNLIDRLSRVEHQASEITEKISSNEKQMQTDHLTQLPNRQAYEQFAQQAIKEQSAEHTTPLIFVMADIDYFKNINDTYGHIAGDKALKIISQLLKKHFNNDTFLGRYGGEEFIIISKNLSIEDFKACIEKARTQLENTPFHFNKQPVTITMSFGLATHQEQENETAVLTRADKALYQAKEAGRNRLITETLLH